MSTTFNKNDGMMESLSGNEKIKFTSPKASNTTCDTGCKIECSFFLERKNLMPKYVCMKIKFIDKTIRFNVTTVCIERHTNNSVTCK